MSKPGNLSKLLEAFFTEYLFSQREASQHTIASYRDTFRLLLQYAQAQLKKAPVTLTLDDLDAPFVGKFLTHMEKSRGAGARTRNQRLTAIRSLFRYAALNVPEKSGLIQRVLAIPSKRYDRALVQFLIRPEIDALLAAPDRKVWGGRRDHALLLTAIQTGLRVSELVGLRYQDIIFGTGAHVRCFGKGRKERCTPLTKQTAAVLKVWLQEGRGKPEDLVFSNSHGGRLTTQGVQYILEKNVTLAKSTCPSIGEKRVSPHVLRHSTAIQLLQAGVDLSVIALWLGHESTETTQIYLDANLKMKEEILKKTQPYKTRPGRYRADDRLLAFLKDL